LIGDRSFLINAL